jgi:hypothetical protein
LKRDEATAALDDGSKAAIGRQDLRAQLANFRPVIPGGFLFHAAGAEQVRSSMNLSGNGTE